MKLTLEAARKRVAGSQGARKGELTARHLLLHPQEVSTATPEEIDWLRAYLFREGWRTLYAHDRRMYRLLREGAGKLADLDDRLLRGEIGGYRKWLAGRAGLGVGPVRGPERVDRDAALELVPAAPPAQRR